MELILIIIFWAVFKNIIKPALEGQAVDKENQQKQVTYEMPKHATRMDSAKVQVQREQIRQAAMQNVEKAKKRAQEKLREIERDVVAELNSVASSEPEEKPMKRSAMQQVHEGRVAARTTTINERAKANTDAQKTDVTLETMEAEHNHSERVAPAVHHHPEDVMGESMLGTVEDLMVKGYDGNLCFERDFVGEGLDMISRFSYQ